MQFQIKKIIVLSQVLLFRICDNAQINKIADAATYLWNFNYLETESDSSSEGSQSYVSLEKSIKLFQCAWGLLETGILSIETKDLMNTPRCGFPDEIPTNCSHYNVRKKRYSVGARWRRTYLTYDISKYGTYFNKDQAETDIKRAFDMWSDVSTLQFDKVNGNADIDLRFENGDHGDGDPFDGPGGTLAHAFLPSTRGSLAGDAHFDNAENFNGGINFLQIAAHEFGHSLGLGHSNNNKALMAPFYRGYDPNFKLHADDIAGIQYLYGSKPQTQDTTSIPTAKATSNNDTPITTRQPPNPQDPCQDPRNFEFVKTADNNVYAFKGAFFYKLNRLSYDEGYPKLINQETWPSLPQYIDAAFYKNNKTYFFKNDFVYVFENQRYIETKLIGDYITWAPSYIDAAFIYPTSGGLYLVKGAYYYKIRQMKNSEQLYVSYTKPLSRWWKYTNEIDSSFIYVNGRLYIFSGNEYYRWNTRYKSKDQSYPRSIGEYWLGCNSQSMSLILPEAMDSISNDINETKKVFDDDSFDDFEINVEGKGNGNIIHLHFGLFLIICLSIWK